ncbi:ABC transporter ATP-binding protein [Anaerosacchariphilus polymeriproducens]|uniref:ABC transporter ATP-binding protein n=1 Tax=Anaerosacchariphilus polymeriproducens TaxID=1812858 RepID=A0A371AYL3_9FIRM|nr:ABC transporter ATP-binding protein [Anaerosacchariphilus polymeriproducens]RDU24656.1 ABC transporter ATP-binding protein [Anaerosacchariphilus polymeriproducens]
MDEILKVENVRKQYGGRYNKTPALNGVSFSVKRSEFTGIMGPSGSGKTTLLNVISTIDSATSGNIILDGQEVVKMNANKSAKFRREKLGFIFQDYNLLDTLNVHENIALALSIQGERPELIDKNVENIARTLNIYDILNKFPYQISGGEKQRVSAARAIVTNPSLVLADEPTGALDSKSAQMLMETMQTINLEIGATILMVTHDIFSASFCKRILFIKDGVVFTELVCGSDTRNQFFDKILNVISLLGGL